MFELLDSSGPVGTMVVLSTVVLLLAGCLMMAMSCTRKSFAIYAAAVWFPLILGAAGTHAALDEMERAPITHSDAIGPRAQKRLRAELRIPLNLGIACTLILLPVAAIGTVRAPKHAAVRTDRPSEPNPAA